MYSNSAFIIRIKGLDTGYLGYDLIQHGSGRIQLITVVERVSKIDKSRMYYDNVYSTSNNQTKAVTST